MKPLFKKKEKTEETEPSTTAKLTVYKDGTFIFNCDICNIASTGYFCKHFPEKTKQVDKRFLLSLKGGKK